MTPQERAAELAKAANRCCERSDRFEVDFQTFALMHLEAAIREERESVARMAEKVQATYVTYELPGDDRDFITREVNDFADLIRRTIS